MRTRILVPALLMLSACAGGASDVEYTPSRATNQDIDATYQGSGPTSINRGFTFGGDSEPKGVFPWRADERH
ncbi:MAG TPA: hypothetical protein VET85_07560 [Stellaceae bacterium]|nr:hypothetical protein [Stellaceae bacterium]